MDEPSYSKDILYAYSQLGLDVGAVAAAIEEVVNNAVAYRYATRERTTKVQRFADFFTARGMLVELDISYPYIRKAYHKKAMQLHPDRHQGDKIAEEKLKELNNAFELVEAIHREALDYFKQPETIQHEIAFEARQQTKREAQASTRQSSAQQQQAPRENYSASYASGYRATEKIKYMAASVPRQVRTSRLSYLRRQSIIGCWSVPQRGGGFYTFDIIMLTEQEFARARNYLAASDMANTSIAHGGFSPPYVLKDVKEIDIAAGTDDPEASARAYFLELFRPLMAQISNS